MGFLDDVVGKAKGAVEPGGGPPDLLGGILGLLSGGGEGGGFAGLIRSFQDKGLGEAVSSWIGTGENMPISAEQVKSALGPDVIGRLAAKAGLPANIAESRVADLLPMLIDKLTPDGKVPEPGVLQEAISLLKGSPPKA